MKKLEKDHKWYELSDGIFKMRVGAHKKSCLFCSHCSDVVWDFTNGPYMITCDLGLMDPEKYALDYVKMSFEGLCPKWEGKD